MVFVLNGWVVGCLICVQLDETLFLYSVSSTNLGKKPTSATDRMASFMIS